MVSQLKDLDYHVIKWNLDSLDWVNHETNPEASVDVIRNIPKFRKGHRKSYILLQHDTYKETVRHQKKVIRIVRRKGYKLVTMEECLGGVNPYFV